MIKLTKFSTFIIVVFYLNSLPSLAETNSVDIDSLLATANKNKGLDHKKYRQALKNLKIQTSNFNPEQSNEYKYFLAYEYSYQAEFTKSEELIKKTLQQSILYPLRYKLESLLLNVFSASQQWSQATLQASKLVGLSIENISPHQYQLSLLTLIAFYNQIGQPEKSFMYLNKIQPHTLTARNKCIYFQVDLEAKIEEKPLFVTETAMRQAIDVCEAAEEFLFSGIVRVYFADWLSDKRKHQEAINILLPQIKRLEEINYPILSALSYNALAKAYYEKYNIINAKYYAELAHDFANKLINTKQPVDTYHTLYLIAQASGDYKNALTFHEEYASADKAYIDEVKAKTIAFHMSKHNEFAKLKEIELLNSENERMALEAKLANTGKSNFYFLIFFLLSVIIVGGIWSYRSWLLKEKLRNIVEFDPLTGLLSRVYFNETSKKIITKMEKKEKEVCCFIFDIDYFKQINDTYGHSGGDIVLKRIAEACEKLAPSNKLFGRIAGEEFALMFPDCSLLLAHGYAEDYKNAILALDFSDVGIQPIVSASFGITSTEISGYDFDKIMGDADSAMYSSKNHGRNKVTPYRKSRR